MEPSVFIQLPRRPACTSMTHSWTAETALRFSVMSCPSDVRSRRHSPVLRASAAMDGTSDAVIASAVVGKEGRLSTNKAFQRSTSLWLKPLSLILTPIGCTGGGYGVADRSRSKALSQRSSYFFPHRGLSTSGPDIPSVGEGPVRAPANPFPVRDGKIRVNPFRSPSSPRSTGTGPGARHEAVRDPGTNACDVHCITQLPGALAVSGLFFSRRSAHG